jgi:hypothetical protein
MNSASLCSLAGRYENPIPPRCLAPMDFLKIPALATKLFAGVVDTGQKYQKALFIGVNETADKKRQC